MLHFVFLDRNVVWAAARGDVEEGGNGLSSNSVCMANGLIYKGYTLQRYSDKDHKFLFNGTRVKYLNLDERACIVCMSQYIRFGRIAYLQKPLIIVYLACPEVLDA